MFYCVLCRGEIDPARARRGGVTCSPECARECSRLKRHLSAETKCRLCGRRFRKRKPVEEALGPSKGFRASEQKESKFTPVRDPHNHVARIV
jgi:hypothetical protein